MDFEAFDKILLVGLSNRLRLIESKLNWLIGWKEAKVAECFSDWMSVICEVSEGLVLIPLLLFVMHSDNFCVNVGG